MVDQVSIHDILAEFRELSPNKRRKSGLLAFCFLA